MGRELTQPETLGMGLKNSDVVFLWQVHMRSFQPLQRMGLPFYLPNFPSMRRRGSRWQRSLHGRSASGVKQSGYHILDCALSLISMLAVSKENAKSSSMRLLDIVIAIWLRTLHNFVGPALHINIWYANY